MCRNCPCPGPIVVLFSLFLCIELDWKHVPNSTYRYCLMVADGSMPEQEPVSIQAVWFGGIEGINYACLK